MPPLISLITCRAELHCLITCRVELHCFAWSFVSHVDVRWLLVSYHAFVVLRCRCWYVLSWIKPSERFPSSLGSVVTDLTGRMRQKRGFLFCSRVFIKQWNCRIPVSWCCYRKHEHMKQRTIVKKSSCRNLRTTVTNGDSRMKKLGATLRGQGKKWGVNINVSLHGDFPL